MERILSFGGGVQSSALVALLGRGEYPGSPPDEVWFCDPRGERPQTYDWIERVIKPYCARMNVPFLTLEREQGPVRGPDLLESYRLRKQFPLRRNRECTMDWKVNVMMREEKKRGYHLCPHNKRNKSTCVECGGAPIIVGVEKHIGISLDELHRARTGEEEDFEVKRYPLIEARLFRDNCKRICQETFGEVPVKSGCYFCKYQRPSQWREVWESRADGRWQRLVEWERDVMAAHGQSTAFIEKGSSGGRQLSLERWAKQWELGEQLSFDEEPVASCDGGYCMV